jgi:hypothetical protein
MIESKRLNVTTQFSVQNGPDAGAPGAAILADAVYNPETRQLRVLDLDGNEIAKTVVNAGDDWVFVAKQLLPRPRGGRSFWSPMPPRPGAPY